MVTQAYMLDKPKAPGPAKRWLDQAAIPALIDAAASGEAVLERVASLTRRAPGPMLLSGCFAGLWAGRLLLRRR